MRNFCSAVVFFGAVNRIDRVDGRNLIQFPTVSIDRPKPPLSGKRHPLLNVTVYILSAEQNRLGRIFHDHICIPKMISRIVGYKEIIDIQKLFKRRICLRILRDIRIK